MLKFIDISFFDVARMTASNTRTKNRGLLRQGAHQSAHFLSLDEAPKKSGENNTLTGDSQRQLRR